MYSTNISARKILALVISLQLSLHGLIVLDKLGLEIPILKPVAGLIYLAFVPGFLILKILKLSDKSIVETLLYSVGLSLSLLMFTGALINSALPLIGISKPIQEVPLLATIDIITIFLCFIFYVQNKKQSISFSMNVNRVFSPSMLFLLLLPFLAVFGAYLVTFYHTNILLLVLLIVISVIPVVIVFDKLPKNLFPLIIWVVSISLLFHTSLVSPYIWGADTNFEMYWSNLVVNNRIWDPTTPSKLNAMLSLVILVPIFSNLLHMNTTWLFKIIYPLIFSLVPLGLYELFKNQTNEKIAFLASYFFMSVPIFYTEMLALARQEIAEFFLVLVFLLLTEEGRIDVKKSFLIMVFTLSLIVSHYGTSYWFMFSLIFVFLANYFKVLKNNKGSIVDPVFISFYIISTLSWYIYVSNGSSFNPLISYFQHHIIGSLSSLFNPSTAIGSTIVNKTLLFKPLNQITIYLNGISQFFITIGIAGILCRLLRGKVTGFKKTYIYFSFSNLIWFIIALGVAYINLGITRVYHLSTLLLAPFFVIGFTIFFKLFVKSEATILKLIGIFLMIFLLFNTGVIAELGGYELSSEALSYSHNWEKATSITDKIKFYHWYTNTFDVSSSKWLGTFKDDNLKIYADKKRSWRLQGYGLISQEKIIILKNGTQIKDKAYIYLGKFNIDNKLITYNLPAGGTLMWWKIPEILPDLDAKSKIYANGGSEIYYQ